MKLVQSWFAGIFVAILAACGGGGDAPKSPPSISTQPQSQSVLTDGAVTFSVTAAGDGLSYQWFKGSSAIAGATASTYSIADVSYLDSGALYKVVVSNADGSVTSEAAQLSLKLSPDQQAFEVINLAPSVGSAQIHWNLNFSGAETSGTNYAYSGIASPIVSPLTNGPQISAEGAPQNMTSTLALTIPGPTRILKNGVILVLPTTLGANRISYVGSGVQVDSLAADNSTVAATQVRSNMSVVPLFGALGTTPDELAHWFNSFFSNTLILNKNSSYAAGAKYLKFDAVNKGDRYNVFDCFDATTDANITPCATETTLTEAMTLGIVSNSDAQTYHLEDGASTTVDGVSVWVANKPRPLSATLTSTVQYRIYFQLGRSVYTGALIKDGAALGGSYWVSNPAGTTVQDRLTLLPYQIRLNKEASDSIASAMAI